MLSASPFSLWTMARADLVRLGVTRPGRSGALASSSELGRVKLTSCERGCGDSVGTTTRSQTSVAAVLILYLMTSKKVSQFTKVKSPDLVDSLSIPLATEDDHEVVDLDSGVGVKAARAGPTADRMPAASH